MRTLLPRSLAPLFALVAIGLAFGHAFSAETPLGRVEGRVVLADTRKPLSGVDVTLTPAGDGDGAAGGAEADTRQRRRATTGPDGRFTLSGVAAGKYTVFAYTRAHRIDEAVVVVREGETAPLPLALVRSEPDLQVAQHQRVFTVGEAAYLPVRGYVDGTKPANTDTVRVRVFATRLSRVLQDEAGAQALERIGRPYDEKPSRLPGALLKPAGGAITPPRLLWQRDLSIVEADREGFFNKRIPLDTGNTAGLFLVDVTHGKRAVSSWVMATNSALVLKRAGARVLAFAVDIRRGTPLAGAEIRAYRRGSVVARGRTDGRGLVEYAAPPDAGESRLVTVALRDDGADEAVLARNDYGHEEQGRFVVHTQTDRPIYRTGQTVFYKGIARRKGSEPGHYAVPAAGTAVTVEVRDPGGNRILRERRATNSFGSFSGQVEISPEAPTGSFSLIYDIDGEKHTADITVASYRKPEFTVTATPDRPRYVRGETVAVALSGRYYFGAPVAGAKVRYSIFRDADWASEYPDDYEPDEGERPGPAGGGYGDYYGQTVSEGETTLDEAGKAVVRFPAGATGGRDGADDAAEETPQGQIYTLYATVTDAAGRSVEAQGRARVVQGDFRLALRPEGYVAEPGKPISIVVQARDHENKPVEGVSLTLDAVYSAWDPEKKRAETEPLATESARTGTDGNALVAITPGRGGEIRLTARASDRAGRAVRGRGYLWAADDAGGDLQTEYADLSLLTDKRRYRPGDTARVLLNTARTGQTALLTIEGERIYETRTVPILRRSTVVRVPIRAAYGPNVVLAACYVRDKRFASSETPLRVTVPARALRVAVRADRAKYRPGDPITYQVRTTDAAGRPAPCEFSFGVVDESIYALREDDPHGLRNAFYPRRYSQVTTGYSFAVEYLGDADKSEPVIEARKRFPDTAFWQPALRTDATGRATVRFALPDNLTTWRATVNACTRDTAVGHETTKVVAAKEFFVRLERPRFLTQTDRTRLLALVHNDTGRAQTALVRLQAEGLTRNGAETQTLSIPAGGIGQASWPVTGDRIGAAKLRCTAWTRDAGPDGAPYTDGIETTLPVRAHGRERFQNAAGALSGTDARADETLTLDPAAVPEASQVVVRVTPSVRVALVGALDYLVDFPYGCTEQTMSRFLPDLLVQRLAREHGAAAAGLDARKRADLPKMVRDGLARLYRFQHAETGGWGWWENDPDDPFMTAYVLYGLSVARAEGYAVSDDVLRRGREAAIKLLEKAKPNDQPFLLYALALAGDTATPRTLRERIPRDKLAPDARAYLVLLDGVLGEPERAAAGIAELDAGARDADGFVHWANPTNRWDSSDRLATALALRAILTTRPDDERIPAILRWLMAQRTESFWGSTRDTAFVLAALCDYLAARPQDAAPDGRVVVRLNGRQVADYALAPENGDGADLVLRIPGTDLKAGGNTLTLERAGAAGAEGGSTVFYSAAFRQTVAGDAALPKSTSAGIVVEREFLRVLPRRRAGADSWRLDTERTGDRFRQGDPLRVRLTLTVPEDLAYVLIEDAFPSGCEVTERGTAEETVAWGYWYSSVDVRDDRIAFFARTLPKGRHVIEYNLRAQTPGSFHALPALLQPMYAPETRAESAETVVDIR